MSTQKHNYEARAILAKEEYFQAKYDVTYEHLQEKYYPLEKEIKFNLAKLLAEEIIKKVKIEESDEHYSRQFRVRVYMYSREDMLRIVNEAYTRGRLDRVGEF